MHDMSTDSDKSSIFEKFVPALLVITVGLAFIVGILWQKVQNIGKVAGTTTTTTQQQEETVKVSMDQLKKLFDKEVIKFGNKDSKLIFVEVSDPSCPYCHVAAGLNPSLNKQIGTRFQLVSDGGTYIAPVTEMKKLVDEGKASYIWIYFNGHGNGELASKALYCAFEKNKYWEAHNLLMTDKGYELLNTTIKGDNTQTGKMADFLKSAVEATDLKKCLDSGKYDKRLESDMALGKELGVSGTPGFFVNETNFAGAYSFKDMQAVVDSALK